MQTARVGKDGPTGEAESLRVFDRALELMMKLVDMQGEEFVETEKMNLRDERKRLVAMLEPQALLFDMDGVLANVENSYRLSTLETVRSYGVSLEKRDLERAIVAGFANNDWILSHRILAQNGIQIEFEDLYERYQSFYLGTEDKPGLRENETLLVDRVALETLAERLPLAVVTGRPRAEAGWFLQRVGIADLFRTTVCLEDGPNKPDPAPVRLALERLGVDRAWLIGDTPDDIRAAVAAGALPLAILAPEADAEMTKRAFMDAGAVAVLKNVESLLDLLP